MTDPVQSGTAAPEGEPQATGDVAEWVVFACDDHWFGLPIRRVREVVPPQPFTRLPGSDAAVCGLIGLRGRVVTVIDFGAAVGLRPSAAGADYRILLLDRGETLVGLAVGSVVGVARTARELDVAGSVFDALDAGREEWIGVGAHGDRPFVVADADRMFARLLQE